MYDKIFPILAKLDEEAAKKIIDKLISKMAVKEQTKTGKHKTLATYIRVTLELFKQVLLTSPTTKAEIDERIKEIIALERELLKTSKLLAELELLFSQNK
jgi:hypothetical protein